MASAVSATHAGHIGASGQQHRQRNAPFRSRAFISHGNALNRPAGRRHRSAKQPPPQAVFKQLGSLFSTDPAEKTRKKYQDKVAAINALEPAVQALSNDGLRAKTAEFRERLARGEPLDSLLVEAFAVRRRQRSRRRRGVGRGAAGGAPARLLPGPSAARPCPPPAALPSPSLTLLITNATALPQVVREASRRVLGLRPFDVQLIGGMILHEGQIAEMRTGEGKTLVAVLPSYLNALTGRGVHVVTVNDYLARRDSEWVGQVGAGGWWVGGCRWTGVGAGGCWWGLGQQGRPPGQRMLVGAGPS